MAFFYFVMCFCVSGNVLSLNIKAFAKPAASFKKPALLVVCVKQGFVASEPGSIIPSDDDIANSFAISGLIVHLDFICLKGSVIELDYYFPPCPDDIPLTIMGQVIGS